MATEKRDIELAIRATDLSTAELRRVASSVDAISAGLQKQAEAARKGEISVSELKQTLEELRQAGTALANQQGLIDSFTRLSGAIAKSETALQEAQARLASFNNEAARGDSLTTKQAQRQKNLAEAVGVAERRLEAARARQEEYNKSIAGAEKLTERQEKRQNALAESAAKAGRAVDEARQRLSTFNEETQKGNAARFTQQQEALGRAVGAATTTLNNQQAELARVSAAMEAAGLDAKNLAASQQQIITTAAQIGASRTALNTTIAAYAQNQRDATAATRAQEKAERDAAKASADRAALVARTLEIVSERRKNEERLIQAVRVAENAAEREAAISAQKRVDENRAQIESFQRLADTLERTAQGFRAISVAQKGTTSTTTLDAVLAATGQQGGVNTAQRRTLEGIEEVNRALRANVSATEAARGPVERYVDTLQDAERTLSRVQAVAKQVDAYETQANAVRRAEAALEAAQAELRRYTAALRDPAQANEELAAKARIAEAAVRNSGATLAEQRGRLANLEQGLTEAGVDTRNLARDQQRLAQVARETTESITRLNAAVRSRGVAEGDNFAIFGFRPYELQNLSFQVNDFFTQIASGTSVMQAFAQQIGQVIQIERVGTFLARIAPIALGAAAGLTVLVASLVEVNRQAALLRAANAQDILGGGFSPRQIAEATNAARRIGLSFQEAREAALQFARLPISQLDYGTLVNTVANLALVSGDAKRETDRLREAFSGGTRGILELDDQLKFLNNTQREFVANARTSTDIATAQQIAISALSDAARRAKDEATTPLGNAFRDLRLAWIEFLETLEKNGAATAAGVAVRALAGGVRELADAMRDVIPLLPALFRLLGSVVPEGVPVQSAGIAGPFGAIGRVISGVRALGRRAASQGAPGGTQGSNAAPNPDPAAATPEQVDEFFRRDSQNRDRIARSEDEAIARRRELAALDDKIRQGTQRNATEAQRLASIEAAAEKARREARQEFGNANQQRIEDLANDARRRQAEAVEEARQRDAERNARAAVAERRRELSDIEQDIRNVEQQRADATRDIQEAVASGAITAVEGMRRLQRVMDETRPKFRDLADEAERFVNANRGQDGLRDTRADALISRTRRLADGGGEQAGAGALLRQQQTQLQQAVQERSQLVQTINALEQQGAITSSEAQRRIAAAYASTNESITAQINALEELVAAQEASGKIGVTQAAAIRAQIELARSQLNLADPDITRVRQAFEQTATGEGVRAFNDVAQAIGEAALNMRSFGDAAEVAQRATLNFFGSLLRSIAEAILKQQILNAVQAASAFFGGAFSTPVGATNIPIRPAGIGGIGSARLGGVVGPRGIINNTKPRRVNPSWFVNAPHYQSGGLPGLRPDEEAAILHRGEEVLTKDDPRNILNMMKQNGSGGGGGGETGIRQVLVMDPNAITEALSGAEGEKVIVTYLRKNAATVRQIVRG